MVGWLMKLRIAALENIFWTHSTGFAGRIFSVMERIRRLRNLSVTATVLRVYFACSPTPIPLFFPVFSRYNH
jgi:hypothetical protein